MADMDISGKKTGKRSTRVDLTPMVDLGFLLITFFIFTTALTKPTALKIFLPETVPDIIRQNTAVSGVLTLLIASDKRVFFYERDDAQQMRPVKVNGIRDLVLNKKKKTDPKKFMVIIKPSKDSDLETLIKVLDEMRINDVQHYAMVDIDPAEYIYMH